MAETKFTLQSTAKLNDGREIPLFGLGVYQSKPGDTTKNAVLWALEQGVRHIDTAKIYSNESSVGQAVKESGLKREDIFVTTKLWDSDQGYESAIKACQTSLEKLGLGYIDLYILHSPNPGKVKRLASWKALEELVARGLVKSIGVSNFGVHHLKELLDSKPTILPAINQVELHPWLTRNEIVDFCQKNNIVLEAYSPLAKAARMNDKTLVEIAKKYNKTPAQVLIRWSLQRGFVTLPKSVHQNRIIENIQVYDFNLDQSDMTALNKLDEYFVTGWDPTTSA